MVEVHPKYLAGDIHACLFRKNALNPDRKIECTCARMMGKSPDVQFGIWFSTWNVGSILRKRCEVSETLKTCQYLLFAGSKAERARG